MKYSRAANYSTVDDGVHFEAIRKAVVFGDSGRLHNLLQASLPDDVNRPCRGSLCTEKGSACAGVGCMTLLHIAAEVGDERTVACLLEVPGLDVNRVSRCAGTPLEAALSNGRTFSRSIRTLLADERVLPFVESEGRSFEDMLVLSAVPCCFVKFSLLLMYRGHSVLAQLPKAAAAAAVRITAAMDVRKADHWPPTSILLASHSKILDLLDRVQQSPQATIRELQDSDALFAYDGGWIRKMAESTSAPQSSPHLLGLDGGAVPNTIENADQRSTASPDTTEEGTACPDMDVDTRPTAIVSEYPYPPGCTVTPFGDIAPAAQPCSSSRAAPTSSPSFSSLLARVRSGDLPIAMALDTAGVLSEFVARRQGLPKIGSCWMLEHSQDVVELKWIPLPSGSPHWHLGDSMCGAASFVPTSCEFLRYLEFGDYDQARGVFTPWTGDLQEAEGGTPHCDASERILNAVKVFVYGDASTVEMRFTAPNGLLDFTWGAWCNGRRLGAGPVAYNCSTVRVGEKYLLSLSMRAAAGRGGRHPAFVRITGVSRREESGPNEREFWDSQVQAWITHPFVNLVHDVRISPKDLAAVVPGSASQRRSSLDIPSTGPSATASVVASVMASPSTSVAQVVSEMTLGPDTLSGHSTSGLVVTDNGDVMVLGMVVASPIGVVSESAESAESAETAETAETVETAHVGGGTDGRTDGGDDGDAFLDDYSRVNHVADSVVIGDLPSEQMQETGDLGAVAVQDGTGPLGAPAPGSTSTKGWWPFSL